ncbi:mechanosensitive ion channel family protein [Mangrovimicrobium sediminis]|uniref:Mechanosensing system component YbdG n=1 Tax=Mangrovimicrobium sediminis TaxID=2562682 RepID=A0A4Z0M8V0_9GAMM|nr:mechanosensitive ion channel family protein [Haliea sp. SAOS-164]TGD75830.1 mechanosensitive ion channel family protein [Haliea sp. SAOS-164]
MLQELANIHRLLPDLVLLGALLLVALFTYWLARTVLVRTARRLAKRSVATWDDALVQHKVVGRLAQMVPAFIIYVGIDLLPRIDADLERVVLNVTGAYMILIVTFTLSALLQATNTIYEATPRARQRPIKGFLQLVQLVIWIIGLILFVAALIDRSPVILLSGFGAATAVLMLIFKDTILSLVASVQLNAQDMIHVGDWIEAPQFGADGDVIDVQLHTVKVQNWDKTITTIPTHRLISDPFRNWRGMSESGGRRIKRSLYLDAGSVRFLTAAEIERARRVALLQDYLEDKENELAEYNRQLAARDIEGEINMRRLTNIGTFRAYIFQYLKHHPMIRQDMTLLVRQQQAAAEGIPIEVYCFTATTAWAEYEGIQSDIFDHLFAVVGEFGLRLYQHPSGADLAQLGAPLAGQGGHGQ